WMKTTGSLIGGKLIDDPRIYRAYAQYFVKVVQAYARAGIPIDAVTVQNEPQNRTPKGYPGMDLPLAQERTLIQALGPALRSAGLRTKILGYDHNWSEHPDDIASTPPGQNPELHYAADLLADPATRAGSPVPPTTATSATRRRRPSSTTGTRTRPCTSPSARGWCP